MKTFISKTLIFITISTILIGTIFFTITYLIRTNINFKIKPVNNIILGHSHPQCAFNDSIINNFKNLGNGGESYFYTFQKIKKLIPQNKNIRNVFVEFSNNQIDSSMNNWIWGDTHINGKRCYLPFLNKEDINLLWNNNRKGFITAYSSFFRNDVLRILFCDFYPEKNGGYLWLNRFKTDSLVQTSKRKNIKPVQNIDAVSISSIIYLEKIVDFCNKNNINVYFIRSPQHIYYKHRKNEEEFMRIKNKKFANVEFLDFNNYPLKNDEFGDFGHLNYKGAKKFSIWFNKLLNKGLLSKNKKAEFILKEINKVRTHNKDYK